MRSIDHVGVDVERGGDARMPELFLRDLDGRNRELLALAERNTVRRFPESR